MSYDKDIDQNLQWLRMTRKLYEQDHVKDPNLDLQEKPEIEEPEVEDMSSLEILEKIKKLVNQDLTDEEELNTQAEAILKKIGKYLGEFKEEKPEEKVPPPTESPTSPSQANALSAVSPTGDMDQQFGASYQPTPPSGGQI